MADNKIIVVDGKNQTEVNEVKGLKINFKGEHSIVKVPKNARFTNCIFNMVSNCVIEIEETKNEIKDVMVFMNSYNKISIGKNFFTLGAEFRMQENFVSFKCGNDCVLSKEVVVQVSDGYAIFDAKSHKVLNKGMMVALGNHVWVGRKAMLLKKSYVNDNSIVGAGSIVSKKITEKNVEIAGVPAKIVKHRVNWDRKTPEEYK